MNSIAVQVILPFEIEITKESSGYYSCYIPFYNINFSTKDKDMIGTKGIAIVKAYLSALVERNNV